MYLSRDLALYKKRNMKLKLLFYSFVIAFISCENSNEPATTNDQKDSKRIEIIPFFTNTVRFSSIDNNKLNILDSISAKNLKLMLISELKNDSLQLYDSPSAKKSMTRKNIQERYSLCDSIMFTDEKNGAQTSGYFCDSTGFIDLINKVEFYESWFIDPNSKEIYKEQLGYSVWLYFDWSKKYRLLYMKFKNKGAKERTEKFYKTDTLQLDFNYTTSP